MVGDRDSVLVENLANLPNERFAKLAKILCQHRSIKHAFDWLRTLKPPATFSSAVGQDEFSFDIIAELTSGLYLSYDSN